MSAVRKFKTSAADQGQDLTAFVARVLAIPTELALGRISAGAVYVDRSRVLDPERAVAPGQQVVIHPAADAAVPKLAVIHIDEEVVIVDKPAGVPSQAMRGERVSAADHAIYERYPGARLFHRLDRDVTGLLLFTRTHRAHASFREYLDSGQLIRRYRAIVHGMVTADDGCFDAPIGPDPHDHTRQRAGVGKPARTQFRVLERGATTTELELVLDTGRTHQIRVHLAHAGHPVLGDGKYGEAGSCLALVAMELEWPRRTVESTLGQAVLAAAREVRS